MFNRSPCPVSSEIPLHVAEPCSVSACVNFSAAVSLQTHGHRFWNQALPYSCNRIAHAVCKSRTLFVQTESCGFHSKNNYTEGIQMNLRTETTLHFALVFTYVWLFAHKNIDFNKFKCAFFHLPILLQSL